MRPRAASRSAGRTTLSGRITSHAIFHENANHLNLVGLFTAPFGGSCGLWRHRVEFVDREGTVLERMQALTAEEAVELATFLNEREVAA